MYTNQSTLPQHFRVTGLKVVIKYSIKILPNLHIVMFKLSYKTEKGAPTTGWHLPCQLLCPTLLQSPLIHISN